MDNNPPPFDPPMTAEQIKITDSLTKADIEKIDTQLLKNTTNRWSKSAMVIAITLSDFNETYPDVPDLYYSARLMHLNKMGKIQSQGNLRRMRYSEVKLPE